MHACSHLSIKQKQRRTFSFPFSSFGTWKAVAKYVDSPEESFSTPFEVKEYGRKKSHPCAGRFLPNPQLHSFKSLGSSSGNTLYSPSLCFHWKITYGVSPARLQAFGDYYRRKDVLEEEAHMKKCAVSLS